MFPRPGFSIVILLPFVAAIAAANTLTVTGVHGGDVIEFEGGWRTHLARITAPDRTTSIGYRALDFASRQLVGKTVSVFTCTTDNTANGIVYGEDGLPFAKIMFGKDHATDIAALLLAKGYARVDENCPTDDYDAYKNIESEAQRQGVGLWKGSQPAEEIP